MPCLNYDERIVLTIAETGPLRHISLTWPLERVYSRYSDVYVKVRVDVYGDGRLCLPLADGGRKPGGNEIWTIERKLADRVLMPKRKQV